MSALQTWLEAHPWIDLGAIVVLVSTILDRALPHVSERTARILRPLRWLVDLLSMLPSKGHPLRGGLQVPGLSVSGPAPQKPGVSPRGPGVALIVCLALAASSCATWRAHSARTLQAIGDGGMDAHAFVVARCGPGGSKFVERCSSGDKAACASFDRCFAAVRAIHSLESAVLVGQLAVKAGEGEAVISGAVGAALKSAAIVRDAIAVWRDAP